MKKTSRFALIALLSFTVSEACAQLGIQAGYTFLHGKGTLATGDLGHFSGATRNSGFQVGLTYDFTIVGNLGMQSGLLYSYAAGNVRETNSTISIYPYPGIQRTRSVYQQLDLPVRVRYDLPVTNDFKFFLFGGPVLSYTLSGQVKGWTFQSNDGSYNLRTYENSSYDLYDKYRLMPFELKLGVGLGAHYKHYMLKFSYDWGLLNQYTRGTKSQKVHHHQLNVSVGYVF